MSSLFISHGAPDLPLRPSAARTFLQTLPQSLPEPRAILVISAHWLTEVPTVSTAAQPETLYDFSGFDPSLYHIQYPVPGAVDLALRVQSLLAEAGLPSQTDSERGLDHGAWTPLMLMYPRAQIPVTQLSLQPHQDPAYHWRVGQALRPLLAEGVLIMASGAASHNLGAMGQQTPPWVTAFGQWLVETINGRDRDALLNYQHQAPYAAQNHPTPEHFLPLFVALGAGGDAGELLHDSYTYGVLHMAAFRFGKVTT